MVYVEFATRILLAAVFLAAALSKARNPSSLAKTIYRLGIHSRLTMVAAWGVITYEALLGVLCALGVVPPIATLAAFALLILFAGVSLRAMKQQQLIPCNCFGASDTALGPATLARAALLLLVVGLYYLSFHAAGRVWWPTSIGIAVSSSSLVIEAILFGRWLLMVKNIGALVHDRHQRSAPVSDDGPQLSLQT